MKITVFWDAAPCSLTDVSDGQTSVNFYQTTRRNIPEDSQLQVFLDMLTVSQLIKTFSEFMEREIFTTST
jgi:hypothetical protein